MSQKIAIIGSGISGLTCGHLLAPEHDIQLFEANHYLGGHTNTVDVELDGQSYAIDTGFIVFNDWTYPNFIQLMDKLGVSRQATEMSFSVKNLMTGFEYNGHGLNSLFAQRRNIVNPKFYGFIREILRFNKLCKSQLQQNLPADEQSLFDFLQQHRFSEYFSYNYILPMCAAIWSASLEQIKAFPLSLFLAFFNNHGLLNITNRPQWYTLIGGSRSYIAPLTANFSQRIHLNQGVSKVTRTDSGWQLHFEQQPAQIFDQVIFACHSDQALAMLDQPSQEHQQILGSIEYAPNDVVLHTDTSVLPKRPLAWASWNYLLDGNQHQPASVTYNMNILQRLEADHTFCVTLNRSHDIDESKVLRRFRYHHPQFNSKALKAQSNRQLICGVDDLHFCGAYWYNGFHEDGVRSALNVCQRFGVTL